MQARTPCGRSARSAGLQKVSTACSGTRKPSHWSSGPQMRGSGSQAACSKAQCSVPRFTRCDSCRMLQVSLWMPRRCAINGRLAFGVWPACVVQEQQVQGSGNFGRAQEVLPDATERPACREYEHRIRAQRIIPCGGPVLDRTSWRSPDLTSKLTTFTNHRFLPERIQHVSQNSCPIPQCLHPVAGMYAAGGQSFRNRWHHVWRQDPETGVQDP